MKKDKNGKNSKNRNKNIKKSKSGGKIHKKTKKIQNYGNPNNDSTGLETLGITESLSFLVLFTSMIIECLVHYLKGPELQGYHHCNGDGCVLCKTGNKVKKRLLLPVYNIQTRRVEVIVMSDSLTPHALLPQLLNLFESEKNMTKRFVIISKGFDKYSFKVETKKLSKDNREDILEAIARIKEKMDDEGLDISSVIRKTSNAVLRQVESVSETLKYLDDE